MAFRKCQVDGHDLMTRSNLIYVGVVGPDDEWRYRLRFCVTHARAVYEDLAEFEVDPESGALSGGDDALTKCLSCGQPVHERRWKLFLTSYPTKNERKDHWASLHTDCSIPSLLSKGPYAE